jgi:hypothetical protein
MGEGYTSHYDLDLLVGDPELRRRIPLIGKDTAARMRIPVAERLALAQFLESEPNSHARDEELPGANPPYMDGADGAKLPWWDLLLRSGLHTSR